MGGQAAQTDARSLRDAALRHAQSHHALVDANSDILAGAADRLITLDSDPRALDHWFRQEAEKQESPR
ncbi:MAG: hypothetical protein NTZ22_10185 [Hyphomicrobiales bacterium]|jgi:hypothetical protein|nr:hypothetical protein [Hyphomicrobiales bacterium]NBS01313.1 hypothetical protein [Hyphomicrobiales bacterium]